jgi:hypothetical protein
MTMKNTVGEICKEIEVERRRQMGAEGWSTKHDDRHATGQLAMAAACYAAPSEILEKRDYHNGTFFMDPWPWDAASDKREKHDRRRRLVIAAALIVAEIERLDRKES